ncbi:Uncharacterised protein [uncultured archaeon]|nr:Uncharacterised protein [uncultured archaeon]
MVGGILEDQSTVHFIFILMTHLQINPLDPEPLPFRMEHYPAMRLLHLRGIRIPCPYDICGELFSKFLYFIDFLIEDKPTVAA